MVANQLTKLFIHGSFANAKSWKRIIEYLNEDTVNIAVNLPGHGGTPDPQDFNRPSLEPEINAIKHALDDAGLLDDELHIIGHSYGGVVALGTAMSHSLPVKKLTLFEPVDVSVLLILGEIQAATKVKKFVEEYKGAAKRSEDYVCARVIDFWGGKGSFDQIPAHIQMQMVAMTENNIRHWDNCKNNGKPITAYQNLQIPVTLVHGSRSNNVAKAICRSLHKNLPNSEIHTIVGASHFLITSHPEQCAEIIRRQ